MKPKFDHSNPENFAIEMARYRVQKMRRFYMHLFIYTIGILVYAAKTYLGAPFNFWPIRYINSFFMWVWTFVIIVQAFKLFLREKVFGTKWEQRKLQEFINQEKQNKWE